MGPADLPLMERIAAADELTAGERVVAGFFEDAYPAVALLKLTEVCAATGVSTATVTRFARKLGYADFRALRRDLQDSAGRAGVLRNARARPR